MDNNIPEVTVNAVEEKKAFPVLGLISMICGILGILIGCTCCTFAGVGLGILAAVLAIIERVTLGKFSGLAIAGLICGGAALVLSVVNMVLGGILGAAMSSNGYYY